MPSWAPEDELELLRHYFIKIGGVITREQAHEISKRMGGRFTVEAIRQRFSKIRKDDNGGSSKSKNGKSPQKSPPAKDKPRAGGERKRKRNALTPSPSASPTEADIETPSRQAPPRKCPRKSYVESDSDNYDIHDKKYSKPEFKAKMDVSGADLPDKIKYEDEEVRLLIDGVSS
ncbi:hypothetical protein IWX49DRAFT_555789 [Phyllosticta citricarpa]|uniref:Clr5 domain-containing protein n=1 Tax=Phyllosticta citricarpa TaxID=55181 RepID=A0ABR1MEZ7_9PEZI